MNTYSFSPSSLAFYANSMQKTMYEPSNAWPADAFDIDDEIAETFMTTSIPEGKVLGVKDGGPAWVDAPLPTHEQYVQQAEQKKTSLLNNASNTTSDWKTELALGIINDDDKASLTAWMQYTQAVKAIDTSKAPDIDWPVEPSS